MKLTEGTTLYVRIDCKAEGKKVKDQNAMFF